MRKGAKFTDSSESLKADLEKVSENDYELNINDDLKDLLIEDETNILEPKSDFKDVIGISQENVEDEYAKIMAQARQINEEDAENGGILIEYEKVEDEMDPQVSNIISNRNIPRMGDTKFAKYGKTGRQGDGGDFDHKKPKVIMSMKDQSFLDKQFKQEIEGVNVYFPFKTYGCQNDFMRKMIKALKNGENALLESPTGTGKTLSLLCSALAWLEAERKTLTGNSDVVLPKIIYTSRTHSQLSQVQRELRNTAFKPRTVILASRDHLCVNTAVNMNRGHALNAACKSVQKAINPCMYFKNRDVAAKSMTWDPLDIEDLHEMAKKKVVCPYFAMKDRAAGADVIFMPYNYIIEEKFRENFDISFENSIIIFDEAHNVVQCCEDVSSFTIEATHLEKVVVELTELQDLRSHNKEIELKSSEDGIEQLKQLTTSFKSYMESYDLNTQQDRYQVQDRFLSTSSCVHPGWKMFELMFYGTRFSQFDTKAQSEKSYNLKENFENDIQPRFDEVVADIAQLNNNAGIRSNIENWFDILKTVMRLYKSKQIESKTNVKKPQSTSGNQIAQYQNGGDRKVSHADDFYLFIYDDEDRSNQRKFQKGKRSLRYNDGASVRKIAFWCFNAGMGMRQLADLKPRSLILTSGTLSPMNSFQAELGIDFPQRIENPHVIDPRQVFVSILPQGIGRSRFNFSYQNRENAQIYVDLGNTLARIAEITPGGILMFFPSYRLMEQCYEHWQNHDIFSKIERHKTLLREPKDASQYQIIMDRYYQCIFEDDKRGAILMAVCRGRISEGLDFSDNAARLVIIVGIPYPQIADSRVVLKKDFLDRRCKNMDLPIEMRQLPGREWYNQQATRAVNQAIGRVIRHAQDYGAIILLDERFAWSNNKNGISAWLRNQIFVPKSDSPFDEYAKHLSGFFKNMESKGFIPKVKQLEQLHVEIAEADEKQIKVNSKKKGGFSQYSDNRVTLKKNNDSNEDNGLGFVPHMFVNKNGADKGPSEDGHNTITKMFKNAAKKNEENKNSQFSRTRKLDSISKPAEIQRASNMLGQNDQKRMKTDNQAKVTMSNLDNFKYTNLQKVRSAPANDKVDAEPLKNTKLGISSNHLQKNAQKNRGLVELLKDALDKPNLDALTKILQKIKVEKKVAPYLVQIQVIFFGSNNKKVQVDNDKFEVRRAALEKLGSVLPKDCLEPYFDYFDDLTGLKLQRPEQKQTSESAKKIVA